MIVANLNRMESAIEIDENDVINVSLNDTCNVEIDAFPDTTFRGVVTNVANSATIRGLGTQEQVTNFEVIVALLDKNKQFRPGMSTTVDIFTETQKDVLKVPISAVTVREKDKLKQNPDVEEQPQENEEKTYQEKKKDLREVVFIVEDSKAVAREVELGISDDYSYQISSGLNEGEEVITGPFSVLSRSLQDGDLVQLKEKEEKNAD
jgi:HlyD family secretion protein